MYINPVFAGVLIGVFGTIFAEIAAMVVYYKMSKKKNKDQ